MTGAAAGVVRAFRGGVEESAHRFHAVAVDDGGAERAAWGDADRSTFWRSGAKPIQALPLVEDDVVGGFGLTDAELALCCASHNGEDRHVDGARSILRKAGVGEGRLACGPHEPMLPAAARALSARGRAPGRIHNNCSGKHAGMLALAAHHGWPLDGYHELEHPVQQRILEAVAAWTGIAPGRMGVAVDGCGVPCFGLPLRAMARAFAGLAAAPEGSPAARIVAAMTGAPAMVAGEGRLCTDLMVATGGRIFAKIGAEGVYCAGVPSLGLGVALKVEDGARRASEPALLAVLEALGVLHPDETAGLADHRTPVLRNTRGEAVGELRAELAPAHVPAPVEG